MRVWEVVVFGGNNGASRVEHSVNRPSEYYDGSDDHNHSAQISVGRSLGLIRF